MNARGSTPEDLNMEDDLPRWIGLITIGKFWSFVGGNALACHIVQQARRFAVFSHAWVTEEPISCDLTRENKSFSAEIHRSESSVATQDSTKPKDEKVARHSCHYSKIRPLRYSAVGTYDSQWGVQRGFRFKRHFKHHLVGFDEQPDDMEKYEPQTTDIKTARPLSPVPNLSMEDGCRRPIRLELAANMSAWTTSAILGYFAREGEVLDVLGYAKSLGAHGETMKRATKYFEPFLSEPPIGILAMNMLVFGISTSTIYHIYRDDQFQDRILAAAMTIGFVAGKLAGLGTEGIILGILPWVILLALSLSAVSHRIMRSMKIISRTHESDLLS